MFEFAGELEPVVNIVFLVVTGGIAIHALRPRRATKDAAAETNSENKPDDMPQFVRMLFGCIAAVFFFLVLFQDVLGIVDFGA